MEQPQRVAAAEEGRSEETRTFSCRPPRWKPVTWNVELAKAAEKAFRRLPPPERGRIGKALDALSSDPRPAGKHVKAIQGTKDAFLRYRAGDYRIMYEVIDEDRVVLVSAILNRRDLEKWLRRSR